MRIRKLLSSVLVLAMVLVMCGAAWSPVSAAQFDDVKASDYYSNAVNWAYNNWVTAGKDATHFAPKEPCTREQVVTFLWRSNGSPLVNGESPFDDVRVTNYFFSPVVWAVSNNITAGTGDRLFGVGKACTRAMVVTFLWRNAGSPTVLNGATFSDVSRNDYFYQAVQWAVSKKITAGTGNGRFSPNATCTRGEIVQFLYKYTDGAAIAQPQDFSEAYWPVVANTLRMLNKQSYNANYVADNQDLKNAIGKASGVGVSLIDLDKDGIVELLIGDINTIKKTNQNDRYYSYFWVLYTVKGGYAVQVTSSTEQDRHYLCDDGTILRVGNKADGTEYYESMQFKKQELYVTECLFQDQGHRCYSALGDDGIPEKNNDTRRTSYEDATRNNLGQIEYQRMVTTMQAQITKPPYVAITAYSQ